MFPPLAPFLGRRAPPPARAGDRRLAERAHERARVLVAAELVGVADAARDQERVVVVDPDLLHRPVDLHRARRVEMVEGPDLAVVDRDDLGRGAGLLERLARLLEL